MSANQTCQAWSNRLTYILTVAGATVGFGATWRFPYLVGENGDDAYASLLCTAMFVTGTPMISVGNVIGRHKDVDALDAFGDSMSGKFVAKIWELVNWMDLIGTFGIIAYYMVLGGWVTSYIVNTISRDLNISSPINDEVTKSSSTEHIESSPWGIAFYTLLLAAVSQWILVKGAIGGIEEAAKHLMPLLLLFLTAMAMHNITLSGTMGGITFYLKPDFSKITVEFFVLVLGRVFFALSLGFDVMAALSSYLDKNKNLVQIAVIMVTTNTTIAVLAGFMIFPSLFSFSVAPSSGPTLAFQSLPIMFSNMWARPVFVVIFFSLLLIAVPTTSLTIYEVLTTTIQKKTKVRCTVAITIVLAAIFIFGNIPPVLSYGPWKDVSVFDKNIFGAFDYISGNILFMLTAFDSVLFVGPVMEDEARDELLYKDNHTTVDIWFVYVKYLVPPVILLIFVNDLF